LFAAFHLFININHSIVMKQLFVCVWLLLGTNTIVKACDICGCTANGQSLGILPQFYQHFIGLQYQYRSYHSQTALSVDGTAGANSNEYYNTLQIWSRYYIGKRIQLFAFVPYTSNVQHEQGVVTTTSGISDASILANYVLVKQDDCNKAWKQILLTGGGIKLPTGVYGNSSTADKNGLPNLQPGTGTYDFIINTNYTLRHNNYGINTDVSYTITTPNASKYKYGNHLNSSLSAYYLQQRKQWTILPQAGVKCIYALHDYDNYSKHWLNEQSGGYQLFATIGTSIYYKHIGLKELVDLPISQHYSGGAVTSQSQYETGLFFLF
jgi:hypothetical protein